MAEMIVMGVNENGARKVAAVDLTGSTFEVGDGATYKGWSDAQAGTIIAVSASSVTWQRDKATLLNGANSGAEDALTFSAGGFMGHTSGTQRYSYERDEDGITRKFTLRGDGCFWLVGAKTGGRGGKLTAGRAEHYDFNF